VIRPLWVEVQAFRGWRTRTRVPLDRRITVVVAENRRGKSSTLNAIEWCLFGARVEKKDSGLDERADWEVRPRGAGDDPTEVTLALATAEGVVQVCRRRAAGARAGKGDELLVTLPDGATVTGADAERWLAARRLGDWEDYRRAHCFHQEAARRRVLDRGDRSAVLAALLGLDEDRALRETLGELKAGALVKGVDAELDELDRDLQKAALRPQRRLLELEQRLLTDRGLQRSRLGAALEAEVVGRLIGRARALARDLDLAVSLPDPGDTGAVRRWAEAWPRSVRASATVLASLPGLRQRQGALSGAIPLAGPAEGQWRAAEAALAAATQADGDEAGRTRRLEAAEQALNRADAALKAASATVALLEDARQVLAASATPDRCPVCDSAVPGLPQRVGSVLAGLQSSALTALTRARADAVAERDAAKGGLDTLRRLRADRQAAEAAWEARRAALAKLLPAPVPADVLAAANAELARLKAETERLARLEADRDAGLRDHAADLELLEDLQAWGTAVAAVETPLEVKALRAWAELERAVDTAAAFASDLDCLEEVARAAQAARSAARQAAVNATLGEYFAAITGDPSARGLQVHVRRTPKGLDYQLRDASGEAAVPVMNQAALNALSLAALFAQAEAAAARGGLAWVVLDDPVQSLDQVHQHGLAEAMGRLAARCHVLIGVVPSGLVERLRTHVPVERRFLYLAPWREDAGSRVEREEVL
jgi:DNA repair exonuclease SbcCD ATPase subunit